MSVSVLLPGPDSPQPKIDISPAAAPPHDDAVERRWSELTRANPRLFDGPILSVESIDLRSGLIRCRRDGYKRLAVQPEVLTRVDLLSISAILTALDARGLEHTLLGRRGRQTRIYGGHWELAPSGGIDAPPTGQNHIPWSGLIAQLQAELLSETGLAEPLQDPKFIAAIHDPAAFSTDLVFRARLTPTIDRLSLARSNWEYSELRWIPLADLPRFTAAEPTIATTRASLPLLNLT